MLCGFGPNNLSRDYLCPVWGHFSPGPVLQHEVPWPVLKPAAFSAEMITTLVFRDYSRAMPCTGYTTVEYPFLNGYESLLVPGHDMLENKMVP